MDLNYVNKYFEELIPMMHNPLAEHIEKKVKVDISTSPRTFPELQLPFEITGSLPEGLYVCSKLPDFDCMYPESLSSLKLSPPSLIMLDNKPGFVWYVVEEHDTDVLIKQFGRDVLRKMKNNSKSLFCLNPDKIWRSGVFQEKIRRATFNFSDSLFKCDVNVDISGPTYNLEVTVMELQDVFTIKLESDFVLAFQLDRWPRLIVENWLNRDFKSWPSSPTIGRILHNDLFIVPKTSVDGNSELEWRISFSVLEKQLSMEITKPQRVCYKFFKSLSLEYFNNPKILCSYHLKTIFFWTLHELNADKKWDDSHIGERLLDLFDVLINHLKIGSIPNSFLQQMNLLEGISREDLDIVLNQVLVCRNKVENCGCPGINDRPFSNRSWIERYYAGLNFEFTKKAAEKYFTHNDNKQKSWKYFTYVIWIRFLRKNKSSRGEISSIQEKLREDSDIDYLQRCCHKCSHSRDNKVYGSYAILRYVLMESRTESLRLYRQDITDIDEQEHDLVMGTLRFEWDVSQVLR